MALVTATESTPLVLVPEPVLEPMDMVLVLVESLLSLEVLVSMDSMVLALVPVMLLVSEPEWELVLELDK